MAIFGNDKFNARAYAHGSWILVATLTVYVYRDVWPLSTTILSPVDASEGVLLWAKVALLSVAGVFVPLFAPRTFALASFIRQTSMTSARSDEDAL